MNINLYDVLEKYKIKFVKSGQHHHATRGWINVDCPLCSPASQKYRLGINLTTTICNCYVCGPQSLVNVVALVSGTHYNAIKQDLQHLTKVRLSDAPQVKKNLLLPKGRGPLLDAHNKYLKGRKFSPKKIQKIWKIEGIGIASKLSWRIFIPAMLNNEIVSWTTRAVSSVATMRYISAGVEEESISLKSFLYGEDFCHHAIIINEGPLDVWTIGPGAVATCGMSYSKSQLLRMSKYPVRVVCFDNDHSAQKRASKLTNDLSVFEGETYNVTLSGKDANSSPPEEIEELRKTFLH